MRTAREGESVLLHWFCRRDDGTPLETTLQGPPTEMVLGEGLLPAAVEGMVVGMSPGETRRIRVEPEAAFGPYREERVLRVARDRLTATAEPQPGMLVELRDPGPGGMRQGMVIELLGDENVLIDGNHPLAGEVLQYEVTLVGFPS
ncbi:MAG: FKBP-type peptidyl-prolyl cis-trans isomerase [Lentisphaeria bacterium]|nr:FKBP-type peptidyl-prolyl cis-trans isomerase [Lentisphaeria bacterium]